MAIEYRPAVQAALNELGYKSIYDVATPEQSYEFWDKVAEIQRATDQKVNTFVIGLGLTIMIVLMLLTLFIAAAMNGHYPEFIRTWATKNFEAFKQMARFVVDLVVVIVCVGLPLFLCFMGYIEKELREGNL